MMPAELLIEAPLGPPVGLGAYRVEDYDRLPEQPRCELLLGRLYVSPGPSPEHQSVSGVVSRYLDRVVEPLGGRVYTAPLDVVLAEHSVVQPDVFFISASRLGIVQQRVMGAPDLVVEILSPSTVRRDRGEKLNLYAQFGVREYWLVDSPARQIEFLINEGGRFMVAQPAGIEYRSPAFSDIRLDLAAFWSNVESQLLPKR
jgi:Uma2 family endonuclease